MTLDIRLVVIPFRPLPFRPLGVLVIPLVEGQEDEAWVAGGDDAGPAGIIPQTVVLGRIGSVPPCKREFGMHVHSDPPMRLL